VGNVIGAAISNILGAFSLGLLSFNREREVQFDRSARIYSLVLLVLTTLVTPILYFPTRLVWQICGPVLIALFGIYLLLVGIAIKRGIITAPEGSESDSDSDSDTAADADTDDDLEGSSDAGSTVGIAGATETDVLINPPPVAPGVETVSSARNLGANAVPLRRRRQHTLKYHGFYLLFGLFAISLAGYILSQAAINITDQFGISDILFGIVILAIATTLPEKFVAVVSGYRNHPGILVANCVGSNIFLLALCVGIIMVDSRGDLDRGTLSMPELAALWGSTLGLTLMVWFGARFSRWIGVAMLVGYVAFIVLEVTQSNKATIPG
jgi:Ca2+/H+ antiporter